MKRKMKMEIIKNKRKSKCGICRNIILSDYKVFYKRNYHLRCYYIWMCKRMDTFRAEKKKLNRYKRHMLLEGLE